MKISLLVFISLLCAQALAQDCAPKAKVSLHTGKSVCIANLPVASRIVPEWRRPVLDLVNGTRWGLYAIAQGVQAVCNAISFVESPTNLAHTSDHGTRALAICRAQGCECEISILDGIADPRWMGAEASDAAPFMYALTGRTPPENINELSERVKSERREKFKISIETGLIVSEYIFNRLPESEQRAIVNKFPPLLILKISDIGKVSSYQIINRTIAGNNAGSALGSTLGQAAYIDRAFSGRGYSATAQVGAALLGAAVGSIADRPEQRKFIINYGVETPDGAIKSFQYPSIDEIAKPVGQCVWTGDFSEAPHYLCADTLVSFLGRLNKYAILNDPTRKAVDDTVRCNIGTLGILSVTKEECQTLGGKLTTN